MMGIAVGLLNKKVKYFLVKYNDSSNPSNWSYELVLQTSIDNFRPRLIEFKNGLCYISYDDCTKCYLFDQECRDKPHLLEIIQKPYGKVLDCNFS